MIKKKIDKLFLKYQPSYLLNLAAETHVDRSIDKADDFINTNILGTISLLNSSLKYWRKLSYLKKKKFKFIHVSTDEVFGDLGSSKIKFIETSNYLPNSPYSASKASSDHFVSAWNRTFNLPTIITNCSNNYGPYQFPEKLIPITILKAINGEKIQVYGDGKQIRDWIHVEDHVDALYKVMLRGSTSEKYLIGGSNQIQNIKLIYKICDYLNNIMITKPFGINNFRQLITFVEDRPGHDKKYAVNSSKIKKELNWRPKINFEDGIKNTIEWYINNLDWVNIAKKKSKYNFSRLGKLKNI